MKDAKREPVRKSGYGGELNTEREEQTAVLAGKVRQYVVTKGETVGASKPVASRIGMQRDP